MEDAFGRSFTNVISGAYDSDSREIEMISPNRCKTQDRQALRHYR